MTFVFKHNFNDITIAERNQTDIVYIGRFDDGEYEFGCIAGPPCSACLFSTGCFAWEPKHAERKSDFAHFYKPGTTITITPDTHPELYI